MDVDIVYNLYEFQAGIYLPNAFIVSRDKEGRLTHIQQKATTATIGAFNLELTPVRQRLFFLIDALQPTALAKPYQKNRRKPISLEELLEDRDMRKAILRQLDRQLDELLQTAVRYGFPVSWDAERKALVMDFVLEPVAEPLQPLLYFKKTPAGVNYQLKLREGRQIWRISGRQVEAIVNNPAWIMAAYKLYRIDHLNGYLVKPFRDRDEVNIPAASVITYFRSFILRVASKVEIEADGFEVQQFGQLDFCQIEAVRHLFEDRWVLAVQMQYLNTLFGWNDSRPQRTSLEIQADEVRIVQIKRNFAAEQSFLNQLTDLGLAPSPDGSHYQLTDEAYTADPMGMLAWLIQHQAVLRQAGFTIGTPQVDGQEICLQEAHLELKVDTASNDWFDIHGIIQLGDYSFPFLALARHIREGNRFYTLPDGQIFVIPEEWMHRYRDIAGLSQKNGDTLRLTKSQYTLLSSIGVDVPESMGPEEDYPAPTQLRAQLRPYQLEGFRWLAHLYNQQLGACLADDMGLGKTLQTIAALLYAKNCKAERQAIKTEAPAASQLDLFAPAQDLDFLQPLNALIILPASLLYNWEREIKQFAPSLSVCQHTGPRRHKDARILQRYDVVLTTYQTALRDEDLLATIAFEYIVLDESHQIKNRESKVFKSLSSLIAAHKISLSGTPIENSLSDLWSQMQFINPDLLGSFPFFQKEFMGPIERYQDEDKKAKLRQLVQPYLLRRTKEEVAKDLPPLSTQVFYTEMTPDQHKLYEKEKAAARNYLLDNFQANSGQYRILVVQTLTKLRQLVNHPSLLHADYEKDSGKFNDVIEQWSVIRKSGHKVLFFSSFVQYLELFRSAFQQMNEPFAWLTGDLSPKERQQAIDSFQNNPDVTTFLISIKSGGAGLNLTAADYVFILDPWWNPTTEQQAIARAHRIGQNKSVFALKFITKGSIEEKILLLQEKKSQLAEDIIGKFDKMDFDKDELRFLLD